MKKRNRKKKDKYKKDIHDLKGENYYDSDGFQKRFGFGLGNPLGGNSPI